MASVYRKFDAYGLLKSIVRPTHQYVLSCNLDTDNIGKECRSHSNGRCRHRRRRRRGAVRCLCNPHFALQVSYCGLQLALVDECLRDYIIHFFDGVAGRRLRLFCFISGDLVHEFVENGPFTVDFFDLLSEVLQEQIELHEALTREWSEVTVTHFDEI